MISIAEIQQRVAEHFNIRLIEMTSARRARIVARPRQIAMYLAKQFTDKSYPQIGRAFGGRDHSTILHGVRQIEQMCRTDPQIRSDVDFLSSQLQE